MWVVPSILHPKRTPPPRPPCSPGVRLGHGMGSMASVREHKDKNYVSSTSSPAGLNRRGKECGIGLDYSCLNPGSVSCLSFPICWVEKITVPHLIGVCETMGRDNTYKVLALRRHPLNFSFCNYCWQRALSPPQFQFDSPLFLQMDKWRPSGSTHLLKATRT